MHGIHPATNARCADVQRIHSATKGFRQQMCNAFIPQPTVSGGDRYATHSFRNQRFPATDVQRFVFRNQRFPVAGHADMPQFRGGNPYFLSENMYQSVSVTNASMYPRHFARDSHRDAVCTKIPILRNKIKITILLLS